MWLPTLGIAYPFHKRHFRYKGLRPAVLRCLRRSERRLRPFGGHTVKKPLTSILGHLWPTGGYLQVPRLPPLFWTLSNPQKGRVELRGEVRKRICLHNRGPL